MNLHAQELFEEACQLEGIDADRACDLYLQAISEDLLHADAHVNLGRLMQEQGRLEEAERHYRFALFVRPTDSTAAFNLATVLDDLGQEPEAIAQYEAVLDLDPSLKDAHYNLAQLHEARGELQRAFRHLKEYRRILLARGAPERARQL